MDVLLQIFNSFKVKFIFFSNFVANSNTNLLLHILSQNSDVLLFGPFSTLVIDAAIVPSSDASDNKKQDKTGYELDKLSLVMIMPLVDFIFVVIICIIRMLIIKPIVVI